jgi:hypothetical protein
MVGNITYGKGPLSPPYGVFGVVSKGPSSRITGLMSTWDTSLSV